MSYMSRADSRVQPKSDVAVAAAAARKAMILMFYVLAVAIRANSSRAPSPCFPLVGLFFCATAVLAVRRRVI
jgi:hypothetical protein